MLGVTVYPTQSLTKELHDVFVRLLLRWEQRKKPGFAQIGNTGFTTRDSIGGSRATIKHRYFAKDITSPQYIQSQPLPFSGTYLDVKGAGLDEEHASVCLTLGKQDLSSSDRQSSALGSKCINKSFSMHCPIPTDWSMP